MGKISLFNNNTNIINIGSPSFIKDYDLQNVEYTHIEWKPTAGGDTRLIKALDTLEKNKDEINKANAEVVSRIKNSDAFLIDVKPAIDAIEKMDSKTILHSGPPNTWEKMAGPMKGAILGALVYEGLAKDLESAEKLAKSGEIKFAPCHEYNAVGPMAGVISPSMPVHVIYNPKYNKTAYCNINEGLGKVLRFGANNENVIKKLKWIEKSFAPLLKKAIKISGRIDVRNIASQALQMGDECHNRNKAATSLFLREIIPSILKVSTSDEEKIEAVEFMKSNEHYFLNLSMPMCKCALDAGHGVKNSTIVTAMSRNGYEFGIKVSGLGDKWFTAPANYVKGLLFPGFTMDDAAPDIGDSCITETMGIGGFAMAGAPAIVQFVGGNVSDAFAYSREMYEITESENTNFALTTLDFRGTAVGIDIRKVVELNILPIINTGMAHKKPGVGQVGAGLVNPPFECFEKALLEYSKEVEIE